jgi:hypothetical protein
MPVELSKVLDRGGKPTVRELLSSLFFNPADGTIRLNGDRITMQRTTFNVELRREMIRMLGPADARAFLIRLGFLAGQADARFVQTNWPNLDIGDAFTAGTRLHTFSGTVRVETVFNAYDFRKKRFSAEFLWHDSAEAAPFRQAPRSAEPVCWTQLGYASGYASTFFDTLIVYKEIECAAQGHAQCRVIGKPADAWGATDPEVIMFRERVIGSRDEAFSDGPRKAAAKAGAGQLSEFDHLVLAPVRQELDRLAPMSLPVLITGAAGCGRGCAAHYLHRARSGPKAELHRLYGADVDAAVCNEIARRGKTGRQNQAVETILIDAIETVPTTLQPHLTRAIEEGMFGGGPRLIALLEHDGPPEASGLSAELQSVLTTVMIRVPTLAERRSDRLSLARQMMLILSSKIGTSAPDLDAAAAELIERMTWPGNLRQMRNVLTAVLAARRHDGPILAEEIQAQLGRFRDRIAPDADGSGHNLEGLIDRAIEEGGFSISMLEKAAYQSAVKRAGGNLSAAARLLGLTRPQLAYRINGKDTS